MGKGTIQTHLGEGKYSIKLVLHRERVDQRIQELTDAIDQVNLVELAAAETALTDAQAALDQAISDQDAAIATREREKMAAAAKKVAEKAAERDKARVERDRIKLRLASLKKEKTHLQANSPDDPVIEAWCADLTEDLTGEVATVEIPGERNGVAPLIRPGDTSAHPGGAAYDGTRDGQLQPSIAGTPAAVFYNWALLPGWQRWKPMYRLATVTALEGDTCSLDLDQALSSAQSLPVNQADSLSEVPILYMTCNGRAFEVGDRVVVEFEDQDWSKPRVIGFEKEPKSCGAPIYMESGFLDLRPFFPVDEILKTSATLFYGDRQQAALGADPAYLDQIVVTANEVTADPRPYTADGLASLAIPGTDFVPALPTSVLEISNIKRQAGGVKMSELSGKAKWLLQARLGSNNLAGLRAEGFDRLSIDACVIGNDSGLSTGLYTSPDYDYYLLSLSWATGTCHLSWLEFSTEGEVAREYLRAEGPQMSESERERLEIYALSQARIQGYVKLGDGYTVAGFMPHAYAWHFNRDGSRADMVVSRANTYTYGGNLVIYDHTARHVRLSISPRTGFDPEMPITEANLPLSVAMATEEETNYHMRVGLDILWVPDWLTGVNRAVVPITNAPANPAIGEANYACNAPLYCWRDADDGLQMLRYSKTERVNLPKDDAARAAAMANIHLCGVGSRTWDYEDGGYEQTAGFYVVGGPTTVGLTRTGMRRSHVTLTAWTTGASVTKTAGIAGANGPCTPTPLPPTESSADPKYFYHITPGRLRAVSLDGTYGNTTETTAIIPFDSSGAVYLGTRHLAANYGLIERILEIGTIVSIVAEGTRREGGQDVGLGNHTPLNVGLSTTAYPVSFLGVTGEKGPGNTPILLDVDQRPDNVYTQTVDLRTQHHELPISSMTAAGPGNGDTDDPGFATGAWATLFDPPYLVNPFSSLRFSVQESIQGDLFYHGDLLAPAEDQHLALGGFDTGLYGQGVFVGWA